MFLNENAPTIFFSLRLHFPQFRFRIKNLWFMYGFSWGPIITSRRIFSIGICRKRCAGFEILLNQRSCPNDENQHTTSFLISVSIQHVSFSFLENVSWLRGPCLFTEIQDSTLVTSSLFGVKCLLLIYPSPCAAAPRFIRRREGSTLASGPDCPTPTPRPRRCDGVLNREVRSGRIHSWASVVSLSGREDVVQGDVEVPEKEYFIIVPVCTVVSPGTKGYDGGSRMK